MIRKAVAFRSWNLVDCATFKFTIGGVIGIFHWHEGFLPADSEWSVYILVLGTRTHNALLYYVDPFFSHRSYQPSKRRLRHLSQVTTVAEDMHKIFAWYLLQMSTLSNFISSTEETYIPSWQSLPTKLYLTMSRQFTTTARALINYVWGKATRVKEYEESLTKMVAKKTLLKGVIATAEVK